MKCLCVLGVLRTSLGVKIKEEMLEWLTPLYDVTTVEVDPPNNVEFEYPFLKKACEVSIDSTEPVLYLHTKGAACDNPTQSLVRELWKREFGENRDEYFTIAARIDYAVAVAPLTSLKNSICWFNGFVMNYDAALQMNKVLKIQTDRYWYEQQFLNEAGVTCLGEYSYNCDTPESAFNEFIKTIKR